MHQKASFFRKTSNKPTMNDPILEQNDQKDPDSAIPEGLLNTVLARLEAEKQAAQVRRRFILGSFFLVLCSAVCIPAWQSFKNEAINSGFSDYLALGWDDLGSAMHSWQNFVLSLLETLPVVSAVELLTTALMMLLSLRFAAKYAKRAFRYI